MRTCVFIDGENLRHAICQLYPSEFDPRDYLPNADWGALFDDLVSRATNAQGSRIRAYWYVVDLIDCAPAYIPDPIREETQFLNLVKNNDEIKGKIDGLKGVHLQNKLSDIFKKMLGYRRMMLDRRASWIRIQEKIALDHPSVEFRRAGSIRYDILDGSLGSEKAVDVKLAVDLIMLRDIYETAVIVSGDQDYVPAVGIIKDSGKRVINVAFKTRSNKLLPGGARRLNIMTDGSLEISHADLKKHLNL